MRFIGVIFALSALSAAAQPKIPASLPPAEGKMVTQYTMRYIEVKVGDGKLAEAGKVLFVHYTGWLYDPATPDGHGKKFDSSVDRNVPFPFLLGSGKVIKGWDEGVAGMKVGGKRTLVIPPQKGYGERGAGGVIPPNATLLFDVELIEVKK